jgi:hypothetical protein
MITTFILDLILGIVLYRSGEIEIFTFPISE